MLTRKENAQAALNAFRAYVIQQARTNLTKADKNVTKELYDSIGGEVMVNPNSMQLSFSMAEHGEYQDKGVQGFSSNLKAPNSPYKFGSGTGKKGGLTSGINKWVRMRGFQFRNRKNGKFMSYEETAKLITHSVFQKGIRTTNFFTKPFEDAFARLPDDIVEAYGLDIESLLKTSLDNGKIN